MCSNQSCRQDRQNWSLSAIKNPVVYHRAITYPNEILMKNIVAWSIALVTLLHGLYIFLFSPSLCCSFFVGHFNFPHTHAPNLSVYICRCILIMHRKMDNGTNLDQSKNSIVSSKVITLLTHSGEQQDNVET